MKSNQKELVRFEFDNLKIRVVKDGGADNFRFIEASMPKANKDGSYTFSDIETKEYKSKGELIQAAVEIIIPKKFNNKKFVDEFTKQTAKAWFMTVMGNSWFKGDKDTDFEKKGDNVIEVYGIMDTQVIQKHIDTMQKRFKQ